MRNTFSEQLYKSATQNNKISVVVADISPAGSMQKFRSEYPNRFINVGVAEQLMVGFAAGLALSGKKPFIYTIANFALFRPYEIIRVDLCYQNLPVTIVGMGAGVVYSTLGGTHHAIEDVSMACALPNMQVIAPCDPGEVIDAVNFASEHSQSPLYLRIGKSGEPNLTENAVDKFRFGKLRKLQNGTKACIIGYGPVLALAFQANEIAIKQNIAKPSIYSCHTLKPLDKEGLIAVIHKYQKIIVLEEHVYHGGLSMMIKGLMQDEAINKKVISFTLKDEFIHSYGSHQDILSAHGISVKNILEQLY